MDGLCFAAPFVATLQSFYVFTNENYGVRRVHSQSGGDAGPGEAAGCSQEGIKEGRNGCCPPDPPLLVSAGGKKNALHFLE